MLKSEIWRLITSYQHHPEASEYIQQLKNHLDNKPVSNIKEIPQFKANKYGVYTRDDLYELDEENRAIGGGCRQKQSHFLKKNNNFIHKNKNA